MRSPEEVQEMLSPRETSFDSMLFRLMQKADSRNWTILRKAYPHQAHEFVRWLHQRG